MPKITVELDEREWQLLRERAALPKGSVARVIKTLNLIHTAFPSDSPPPSREEIDAYL